MVRLSRLLPALAPLLALAPLRGQSGLELAGFGMHRAAPDVVSQGIGGLTTIPDRTTRWLIGMPATWHNIRATQLQVSAELASSQLGHFGPNTRVGPQGFQFLMHANRSTAFGIGLRPVTRVGVAFTDSSGVFSFPGDTLRYVQSRSAQGGISALILGYSRRLRPSFAVGITLNVLFGTVTQHDTLDFQEQGSWTDPLPLVIAQRRLEFSGQTLGLSLSAAVPPKSRGTLGLRLELPLALSLVEVKSYVANTSSLLPVRHDAVGSPSSLALGYGLDLGQRQRLMVEAAISWLGAGGGDDLIFGRHIEMARSVRIGWTRTPGREEAFVLNRLHYRVGFSRQEYYLSDSNLDPLSEVALGVGIGFRSPRFRHRVDIALQAGRRESLLPGVPEEAFYRLSVGVTTAELWFARPKKSWD